MKKYTLFLFTLSFVLLGFNLNINSTRAYDSGCIGSALYSITTGQLCSASQVNYSNSYGCTSTGPYNTITGQLCSNSQTNFSNAVFNRELQFGSSGSDVTALQQILKDKGYLLGGVDGVYGRNTKIAVAKYQVANNLGPTGKADLITLASLNISFPTPICSNIYLGGISQYGCPTTTQSPVVTGVNGPQSLNVNQQGTWTVTAYSSNGGNLSYSVNWGDQSAYPYAANNSPSYLMSQQSATLSHVYSQMGTYTPIFTVTNSSGQTAQTSLSVVVGSGTNYYGTPTISYLTPNFGPQGTQVTVYGTNFTYNGNTVNFGTTTVPNLYSTNGTSLVFTVPVGVGTIYCIQAPCNQPTSQAYNVSVTNSNGTSSNATTFTVTGSSSGYGIPTISYLYPSSGVVGSQVTIYGSGFARNNCTSFACTNLYVTPNTINFGSNVIQNIYSSDGTSLTFTVPSYTTPACLYSIPACYIAQSQITPGIYPVSVTNNSGTSNAINFSVTGYIIY